MPRRLSIGERKYTAKRPGTGKDRDFVTVARSVVERAIGEKFDGSRLLDPHSGKNPAAVTLGKLGGSKGGKTRAANLSGRRRKQIAKQAAQARWKKD